MNSFRRNIHTHNTPLSIEEYEKYIESFNWKALFSEEYDPFLEEIHRHILYLGQINGEKWLEKYLKTKEKYSKIYKK